MTYFDCNNKFLCLHKNNCIMKKIILSALISLLFYSAQGQILEQVAIPETVTFPVAMNVFKDKLLFVGQTTANGKELWSTDGTTDGSFLVKDIGAYYNVMSYSAFNFNNSKDARGSFGILDNSKMIFAATDDGFAVPRPWVTDGTTAGTFKLSIPGTTLLNARWFKEFNGKLYFISNTNTNGFEIWSSDGTIAGTSMLKDINPGTGHAFNLNWDPCFFVFNNKLFFKADDGSHGIELWSTDGTAVGTNMVLDINTTSGADINTTSAFKVVNYIDQPFIKAGNYFYFAAYTADIAIGGFTVLYKSDGTAAGTSVVPAGPLQAGLPGSYMLNPRSLTWFQNHLYFFAQAQGGVLYTGNGLWKLNPTTALHENIHQVVGMGDNGLSDNTPLNSMREFNGKLYFMGVVSLDKIHLWSTDGTSTGTQKIFQIIPNLDSFVPNEYFRSIAYNNKLYFVCGGAGSENIYTTDGTTAGTLPLFNFTPLSAPYQFKIYENGLNQNKSGNNEPSQQENTTNTSVSALYFGISTDVASGNKLWRVRSENLGTAEPFESKEFIVTPNPSNGLISVHFPKIVNATTVTVINMMGQTVFQQKYNSSDYLKLNISSLTSGMYMLKIQSDQQVYLKKIILK